MAAIAMLLRKKRQLIERREEQNVGPNELADIERRLAEIDYSLSKIENAGRSANLEDVP